MKSEKVSLDPAAGEIAERDIALVVEQMLREIGGDRALSALSRDARLERDLGLGSLERLELFSRLEKRFGLVLSETAMSSTERVSDLFPLVLGGRARTSQDGSMAPSELLGNPEEWQPSRLGPLHEARSLSELLWRRAEREPERVHIHLKEDGEPSRDIRFGELYRDALAVGGGLRAFGIGRKDTVAIMLPTSYDFFVAFMGALMIGAVPVPLYPPVNLNRLKEYAARQTSILDNAQAIVFITLARGRGIGELLRSKVGSLRHVVSVAELKDQAVSLSEPFASRGEDPAFIQYTSGSTGVPKGVLLAHRNLLANLRTIGDVLDVKPSDVGISWLPLYHDMGLIGAWLMPLYYGIPVSIFSPLSFIVRPEKWLWEIHVRRGTLSAAPNFAYELASRKIRDEDLEGLDLSCWRAALNGAEPISPSTLERFSKRFAGFGFRAETMMPVYGLAENSLLLSAPELGRGSRVFSVVRDRFEAEALVEPALESNGSSLRFVSAGKVVPNHELRVLGPEGEVVPEGHEGRLVFKGPSMMQGYYRNPQATDAIRVDGGFLDTGDRGFFHQGELFVTGRAKDLIIRAGRNLVPHDIEQAVSDVEGLRRGSVAAFGVPSETAGTEDLVVVAEVKADASLSESEGRQGLEDRIRAAMVDGHGVVPDQIVLVPPRTVPKTSSGKLRRRECRDRFLRGDLNDASTGIALLTRVGWLSFKTRLAGLLRRSASSVYGAYVWLVSAFFVVVLWALSFIVPTRPLFQALVRFSAKTYLAATLIRLRLEGFDALRAESMPVVFVSNHASYLDPLPLVAALPLDLAFVVKREAWRWPLIGRVIRRLGHLPVERFDLEQSAGSMDAMLALMKRGRSLFIFPEGTFSKATGIRPFKMGAFKLASDAERPILPVAIVGTRKWLRDGRWMPRRSEIRVILGPSRVVGDRFVELADARNQVADEIAGLVGEPRLDLTTAGFQPSPFPPIREH